MAASVCALALSGCTGSGSSSSADASGALKAAVATTTAQKTARLTTTVQDRAPGYVLQPQTTDGVTTLDGSQSVTAAKLPDGMVDSSARFDLDLVVDSPSVWFGFPQATVDGLPGWGQTTVDSARSQLDSTLPAVWRLPDWLSSLDALVDVVDAGPTTLDGTAVTRYKGNLPRTADTIGDSLGSFVGGAASARSEKVPVQVWVDGEGRIVQIVQEWSVDSGSGAVITSTVTIGLSDYGTAVTPKPPTGELSTLTPGQMKVTLGRATG